MTYLEEILASTRVRLEALRLRAQEDLEANAIAQVEPRDFLGAITRPGMSLITEIKRRSPSAGEIRSDVDPSSLAAAYRDGGARAISVLTEPAHFGGSSEDLVLAKESSGLPVLRKDFILHHFQILESRADGADAVLLIVAAIGDRVLLRDLSHAAAELGMAALIEVHRPEELEDALSLDPKLVGVNQRDLTTFAVDRDLAARLRPEIPAGVAVIAESGVANRGDVQKLEDAGIDGVLVGEALMRAEDSARAVSDLLGQ